MSLLARLHRVEQEKAVLAEQLQSAQIMMRSYLEREQQRKSMTDTTPESEQTVQTQVANTSVKQKPLPFVYIQILFMCSYIKCVYKSVVFVISIAPYTLHYTTK